MRFENYKSPLIKFVAQASLSCSGGDGAPSGVQFQNRTVGLGIKVVLLNRTRTRLPGAQQSHTLNMEVCDGGIKAVLFVGHLQGEWEATA